MKKALTIILSAIMVFCMGVPTFAEDNTTQIIYSDPIYLAIGDSVGAGCKMYIEEPEFIEFEKIIGNRKDIDHAQKNFRMDLVKQAYPYMFAKSIGADMERSVNGTHTALTAKDICRILGVPSKLDPGYTNSGIIGNTLGKDLLSILCNDYNSNVYKNAIKTADIITVELGENEFTTFAGGENAKLDILINAVTNAASKAQSASERAELKDLVSRIDRIINRKHFEADDICAMISDAVALSGDAAALTGDIIEGLKDSIGAAAVEYRYYWNLLMKYICQHKKPGTVVIATTLPEPFSGGTLLEKSIMEYVNFSAATPGMLGKLLKPFIVDMNSYIYSKAAVYDYRVANIGDVRMNNGLDYFEDGTVNLSELDLASLKMDSAIIKAGTTQEEINSISILHPNADGHRKIAQELEATYYDTLRAYLPKVSNSTGCRHEETELRDLVEPTYLSEGYSGDMVCTACGKIMTAGTETEKLLPATPQLKKVLAGLKSVTVKWNKQDEVTSYQIQYSTSSDFTKNKKTVTVKGSKSKIRLTKLKSDKKYYVRIRSVLAVNDDSGQTVNCYSKWTGTRTIRL